MNRIYIAIKLFLDRNYSQEGIAYFTKWFLSPYFLKEKEEALKKNWDSLYVLPDVTTKESLKEVEQKMGWQERSKSKTLFFKLSRVAALIFIPLLSFVASWQYINYSLSEMKNNSENSVFSNNVIIEANAGTRIQTFLPDGTKVFLNSGSKLTYDFSKEDRRNVELIGEAYFKVMRDESRPFIVNFESDKIKINVLGTEFNVKAYPEEEILETTLVNGSVCLDIKNNDDYFYKKVLTPSQMGSFDLSNNKLDVYDVDVEVETSWKDGILIFKDLSLPLVLKRLSNYYNVKFDVKDKIINQYKFTGVFNKKQLSQILEYLKISSNIDYKIIPVNGDDSLNIQQEKIILMKSK